MGDIEFTIIENLAVLDGESKWHKELNLVSWNNSEPKYDIRSWNPDHTQFSKGITLTKQELETLQKTRLK